VALLILLAGAAAAQEAASDTVKVNFSDPSRPGLLKADLLNGGITLQGYGGSEVIIKATLRSEKSRSEPSAPAGMRRISIGSTGLEVVESNNVIEVETSSHSRTVDLDIQVPRNTSLQLTCLNNGDVKVSNIQGEVEVKNLNGRVELTGISGSAVVHALNGEIKVVLVEVAANKPMSFSGMNGKIDVTFPASFKADVVMETENGDILTDFDVKMGERAPGPIVEDARSKGGKYKVRVEKEIRGTINGGGPEVRFKTFNGDIYIRKGGSG